MTGRVVVTGYGGFIGAHLCRRLVDGGYSVIGADVKDARLPGVEHCDCDISSYQSLEGLPKEADCVVHLAAIAFIPSAELNFMRTLDVNVMGTYNALKYSCRAGAKSLLFSSTSKVYGSPQYLPVDEKHPLNPTGTYGRSKMAAEELVRAFGAESGGSFTILRQFNIYGVGQSADFFIPSLLAQLKRSNRLSLGNLKVKRDFLYVDDLIDAYMLLIKKGTRGIHTYNIGGGKSIPLTYLVSEAARICKRQPKIEVDKAKFRDDVAEVISDNGLLLKEGWAPKTSLSEGIRKIVQSGGS